VSECIDNMFLVTGRNNSFHSLWYIRWRALNKQEAYRAENHSRTLSHDIFFSYPAHVRARIQLPLISLSPSLLQSLCLSDETHRSGTMVALYSTVALVEFGLAPAKRYSRCSRHVEFIVAERSINRFRALFSHGGGGGLWGLWQRVSRMRAKISRRDIFLAVASIFSDGDFSRKLPFRNFSFSNQYFNKFARSL